MEENRFVGKGIVKKDADALLSGKPVYADDLAPEHCLIVKLLRSPHAHALIKEIKTDIAKKVPGIEAIYTYKDVPRGRFTKAGQTFPEPSPDDRQILDDRVRYVGDPVAIVAGEDELCVDRALKMIKVTYEVLEPLLDFTKSKDNPIIIHPEDNFVAKEGNGTDASRNLCASQSRGEGDVDKVLSECDYVVEEVYHTKAVNQAMMEPFTAFASKDIYGRIKITSSTQIPFHVRRIVARALNISKSRVRVVKPRIGGGFGAKQTAVCEIYPAFVSYMTGKPSKIVYTREDCFVDGSPRHEMQMSVRIGADKEGRIRAIDLHTLSNTGAFGEHGPTTVDLTGTKSISLYRNLDAFRFSSEVVYTNVLSAGAYRGYGATQGLFAVESAVNELAHKMNLDPTILREKNIVKEGDHLANYYGQSTESCALDVCMEKVKEMIGWEEKYPYVKTGPHTVRAVGMALSMQGSGIEHCDVGSVQIKLNDDGFYTLMVGCSDMGTGCDTVLSQMAADGLGCEYDNIIVRGVDTDQSPYDSGSYASSTTYVTGQAVVRACEKMKQRICEEAAALMNLSAKEVEFDGWLISEKENPDNFMKLDDLVTRLQAGSGSIIAVTQSYSGEVSPPPFMAGAAEVEIDLQTGKITPIDYVAVVDCGTVINSNLARVQTEGGIVQGIGMALYEDIQYTPEGKLRNRNFINYKIPTRLDMGQVRVDFASSYEKTGPYGAKSIGEVVINTPSPAIADAVYNGTGLRFRTLPITSEKVFVGLQEKKGNEE
ncbi:MAG: molybdopterin-dependent oxidoreductase [Eubacteriales bacterium]|nr:molybdopterin-dependent oxidoreductase [Eubacteriales bacterium]